MLNHKTNPTMTIAELKEQLQEDLMTYLDGMGDEVIADVCQLVIDRVNQFQSSQTQTND